MKSFVITIKDNPRSVESAKRCIESGKKVGCAIRMFDAITPKDNPMRLFENEGLNFRDIDEKYSRTMNCAAAFFSHYSLWKKCVQMNETFVIFEHDAVLQDKVPTVPFKYVMNIGHPSYGKFNTPSMFGVNPLTSKRYFPGEHAYMVTPQGAKKLVNEAKNGFPRTTDLFLNLDYFPWLQEYYPWTTKVDESFTTIQAELGTRAKHQKVEVIDI